MNYKTSDQKASLILDFFNILSILNMSYGRKNVSRHHLGISFSDL